MTMINRSLLIATLFALGMTGCGTVGYYGQAISGQAALVFKRQPIEKVLANPDSDPEVRRKLGLVLEALEFADSELGLPANGSYRRYVDLDRLFVVWNVFAAPEFSLEPYSWCYPLVGCLSYRGYFKREGAIRLAQSLEKDGYDTMVGGIRAYSTLGWFNDPVLSSFLDYGDDQLVALLFHELSHQVLYLKGDTVFNESFATAVELEGLKRWLESRGRPQSLEDHERRYADQLRVIELVDRFRRSLGEVYRGEMDEALRRRSKQQVFDDLRQAYLELRQSSRIGDNFDHLFDERINNASLTAFGSYFDRVVAFRALFHGAGGDFAEFFRLARALADLDQVERGLRLDALESGSG